MPKPWLKMWGEWIDDPKMNHLSLAEQAAWWRLVTLAHRCNADGVLVHGNGLPLSLDDIVDATRCEDRKNRRVFDSMMAYMIDKGSLQWKDGTLVVINLKKRQEMASSETPEAVRERVRRYRERQAVTENPLQLQEKESTKEKEIIEGDIEGEGESNGKKLVTVTRKPLHAEAVLPQISKTKQKSFEEKKEKLFKKKKKYGEFNNVLLSDEEYQKLKDRFGAKVPDMIEALSEGIESRGYKYQSHYAAILSWERREQRMKGGKNGTHPRGTRGYTAAELRQSLER